MHELRAHFFSIPGILSDDVLEVANGRKTFVDTLLGFVLNPYKDVKQMVVGAFLDRMRSAVIVRLLLRRKVMDAGDAGDRFFEVLDRIESSPKGLFIRQFCQSSWLLAPRLIGVNDADYRS